MFDVLEKTEIYLVSFSKKSDKKSLWQEYASNGVAIGFNDSIFPKDDLNVLGLNECLYKDDDKRDALRKVLTEDIILRKYANVTNTKFDWEKEWGEEWTAIFDALRSAIIELTKTKKVANKLGIPTEVSKKDFQIFNIQLFARIKLAALTCLFKDEHFYEEEESRFFRIMNKGTTEKISFRVNGDNLIPYIPTNINLSSIRRIVYSPTMSDSNKESIKYFLEKNNIKNCQLIESKVPLR
ncbi:DUF2971 domain-containing protein [Draconibacterium orientale]|uniref:DUF2971 domain-containing protein n=1 Tax=Draconibacterium orientale TaxID=1168034 RepID=UPI0029C0A698|nr:DUF2971 domain-containing protein [Draconibacterium orientale]